MRLIYKNFDFFKRLSILIRKEIYEKNIRCVKIADSTVPPHTLDSRGIIHKNKTGQGSGYIGLEQSIMCGDYNVYWRYPDYDLKTINNKAVVCRPF